ncbi:plasmid mobilization relaxosome protein MobC [Clostridiaceae bacterium]|nr:plasmid mobilization relaxosome protein MobC [Clostridiaceae bacterium]
MKKHNTPHRHRVIKTRLTEEEYAEFSERVTLCKMSQAEFIRQALIKSSIRPVITVSPVNDELLSAVGKLTAEYGKIGGNLNQIARCLNEYGGYFLSKSNRGKYCPDCAARVRRRKEADRQRKSIT